MTYSVQYMGKYKDKNYLKNYYLAHKKDCPSCKLVKIAPDALRCRNCAPKFRTQWNKGKKAPQCANKISKKGTLNGWWKGDKAGYSAIHSWAKRNLPKAGWCEVCLKNGRTCWANISGRYERVASDFKELCYSCHYWFDRGREYDNKFKKELSRAYRNGK